MDINGWFPLHLFPSSGLAESVITTVWVGAMVVVYFNQRFGWSLSGLVVPGYLVPLLVLKPISVGVILVEGMTAYLLVRFVFALPARFGWWHVAFGRERFFALILASIFTRISFDTLLLPTFAAWLTRHWHVSLELGAQLHSFGLIIVALIANHFWKPGLRGGLISLGGSLVTTFLIVRFVLLPLTNFTLGNVAYLYEDLAASIMGTPKAYMILVTTALIASRLNQRYGWEFNGILIPALLALQWYQPEKIVLSFLEAVLLVGAARFLVKTPLMRSVNLEGGRKILFFFNLSFFYKYLVSIVLAWFLPEFKVTDAFGFGYMLSTLVAVKMYEKSLVLQMGRATLQTAFYGAVAANLIGFSLLVVQPAKRDAVLQVQEQAPLLRGSLMESLYSQKPFFYRATAKGERTESFHLTDPVATRAWLVSLEEANRYAHSEALVAALHRAEHFGFQAQRLEKRYLLLTPADPHKRSFSLVLDGHGTTPVVVEVAQSVPRPETLAAGVLLARQLKARRFVIHADLTRCPDQEATWLMQQSQAQEPLGLVRVTADDAAKGHVIAATGRLHPAVDTGQLARLFDGQTPVWQTVDDGSPPLPNGSVQVVSEPEALRRWVRRRRHQRAAQVQVVHRGLSTFLLQRHAAAEMVRPKKSGLLRLEETQFRDTELLTPLLQQLLFDPDGTFSLNPADQAAAIGYRLSRVRAGDGRPTWVLHPKRHSHKGATLVMREGGTSGLHVQVPRPFTETSSLAFALDLFHDSGADSLLIGDDRDAGDGRNRDVTRWENRRTLFNIAHQLILRESPQAAKVVQVRARRERASAPSSVAVYWDSLDGKGGRPVLPEALLKAAPWDGKAAVRVDGQADAVGLEVHNLFQARYLTQRPGGSLSVLWLSAALRRQFRETRLRAAEMNRYRALALPFQERDFSLWRPDWSPQKVTSDLDRMVRHYQATGDMLVLAALHRDGYQLAFCEDLATRLGYLAVYDDQDRPLILVNLNNDGRGAAIAAGDRLVHGRFDQRRAGMIVGRTL